MPRSPTQDIKHTESIRILAYPPTGKSTQHGKSRTASSPATDAGLLSLPGESLTHITAFLEPQVLFALGRTCKRLRDHVSEENTWRRAFAYQFLDVPPEADFDDEDAGGRLFFLRREESSWKREFVYRWNMRRRWERSRNPTITHVPHHSTVSDMHLMPNQALLAASLKYGVIARSHTLTGKVLRGFLDAAGMFNGLGVGNPNAEFSPHVCTLALAHEGGTARVLWGFRNGDVAATTAPRAMDGARASAAKHARCRAGDAHTGPVKDIQWGAPALGQESIAVFVTGAADGQVKLWDAKRVKCLWTSPERDTLVPDPVLKVALDTLTGVVVAAMQSGNVFVWTGFGPLAGDDVASTPLAPVERKIEPIPPVIPEDPCQNISRLDLAPCSGRSVEILLAYQDSAYFHRLTVQAGTAEVDRVIFGDGTTGALTALQPVFATQAAERSFVIAGDALGNIHLYSWDALPLPGSKCVPCTRRVAAHEDGAVTALARTPGVIVSGSARGTIKVWDALSLAPLRAFASQAARPAVGAEWDGVSRILLERDMLVASVGARVVAWRAGPVGKNEPAGKGKQPRAAKSTGMAKWHQQLEMYRDIAESRRDLDEEQTYTRRAYGREREQSSTLNKLGLDEVGAVEYVLMLSRDEEQQRRLAEHEAAATSADEGVFLVDDDLQTPVTTPNTFFGSENASAAPSRRPSFSRYGGLYQNGARSPVVMPSNSTGKIQVSLRYRPEPMEAGTSVSPLSGSLSSRMRDPPPSADTEHFPPVSRTPSSAGTVPSTPASSVRRSVSGSPESTRGAWATPLRSARSSAGASPYASGAASPPSGFTRLNGARSGTAGQSLLSAGFAQRGAAEQMTDAEREAEELRFAIELSLAEARSRGEDI